MYSCAVYIRVSTNKEEQKLSLKNQQELFVDYIGSKGWSVYKFYVDVDSGTSSNRKELQNLIADAEDKKFQVILSKELSRLARNSELSHKIKRIADNNNIHIITLDGAINTLEGNRAMFGMYAWIYEQESQRTSERIKCSFASRSRRGLFSGGFAPYGYTCRDGKLYIRDDFTVDVVKRIFKDYISGKGFDAIAKALYEENIPSPSQVAGRPKATEKWHGSGVRLILENPHYTGSLYQSRTSIISVTSNKRKINKEDSFIVVKNTHEAIISEEDFLLVKNLIKSRRRIRPKQTVHLFSQILFCADCGHMMHFKKNRRGYICGSYNKHGTKACTDHIVRESDLSEYVLSKISNIIDEIKNGDTCSTFQKDIVEHKKTIQKKYESLNKKLQLLIAKKSKALHMLVDSQLTKDDYDIIIKDIDSNINILKFECEECKSILNNDLNSQILIELQSIRNSNFDLSDLDRELLVRFIKNIEINENGTAKLHFWIPQLSNI